MTEKTKAGGEFTAWLAALCKEALPAYISAFSLGSSLLTFIPRLALGWLRVVSGVCLIVGFGWANYRLFRKQRLQVFEFEQKASGLQEERARLVIHHNAQPKYLLQQDSPHSYVLKRLFAVFDLTIENQGQVPSVIRNFRVEIQGLPPVTTLKLASGIQGRSSQYGIQASAVEWMKLGLIQPSAGEAKRHTIVFHHEGIPSPSSGFVQDPKTRMYPPLPCKLTLTDTKGNSVSADFTLYEQ